MTLSPYTPGYNLVPPFLAGREPVLSAMETAFAEAREGGRPRWQVLSGPSGVGKTTLLTVLRRRAAAEGWPSMHVEARSSTPLAAILPSQGGTGGVPDLLDAGVEFLRGMARDAPPDGAALLTLDEMQLASRRDLNELCGVFQYARSERLPVVVVLAGLSPLRRAAESWLGDRIHLEAHDIGHLSSEDALRALTVPAEHAGRPFDPDAAQALADRTGGHPYAVQLYGEHAWDASDGESEIGIDAVQAAISDVDPYLERWWYQRQLSSLPEREREYLHELAAELAESGCATSPGVARRLGANTQQLSMYRQRLLDRGLIIPDPQAGTSLRLYMPGMLDYLHARTAA